MEAVTIGGCEMKRKTTAWKVRVILTVTALLLLFIGNGAYVILNGGTYTAVYYIGWEEYLIDTVELTSSDEQILRVTNVRKNIDTEFGNTMQFEVQGVSQGDAAVIITADVNPDYPVGENDVAPEPLHSTWNFYVTPLGVVFDKDFDRFTGIQNLIFTAVCAMLILAAALIWSLIEKYFTGDFSYSMVVHGGVTIYCLIASFMLINDLTSLPEFYVNHLSFGQITYVLFNIGLLFVGLSSVPMLLLALALSVSNIQLVRHEGFRPMNLLGIFLGVVMMGGIVGVYWVNRSVNYETLEAYHVTMLISIAVSYIVCYAECMLLSTMLCALLCTKYKPKYNLDYIIILGCAIRSDGTPTPLLRGRVDRALAFEREQFAKTGKHAKFVPSGGQGSDEVISEAESMRRYLIEQGVPDEQIVKEDKSVNTDQNMKFSKRVIEADGESRDVNIGFSTTNYHVFRGYTLADKLGMKVRGLSAKTKLYFFPNAFIREFIGLLWEQKLRHLIYLFALILSLSVIYIAVDVLI